jgi:hypothetical protein
MVRCDDKMRSFWPHAELEALLRATPGLRVCHAAVNTTDVDEARDMLCADPPFAALRLESLRVHEGDGFTEADAVIALAADLAVCTSVREFELEGAELDVPALDALVDASIACRLHTLRLIYSYVTEHAAPVLARLLGGGALAELEILGDVFLFDEGMPFLVAPAATVLVDALRACSTLTALTLCGVELLHDPAAATALLGALTGHPSLRSLDISINGVEPADREDAAAALGALVGANAPALISLNVSSCDLGDAGLGPLFDALPANTHLRKLNCVDNALTDAFMREQLLPAVRANTSLVELCLNDDDNYCDEAAEAMAIVERRAAR